MGRALIAVGLAVALAACSLQVLLNLVRASQRKADFGRYVNCRRTPGALDAA
jgi:hypothetical protein